MAMVGFLQFTPLCNDAAAQVAASYEAVASRFEALVAEHLQMAAQAKP